jgi:hypothetical protein
MEPSSEAKERRKGYNDRGEAGGQSRHGGVSWRKRCQSTASFASPPRAPSSPAKMAKVELSLRNGDFDTVHFANALRSSGDIRKSLIVGCIRFDTIVPQY